jgi:hypothetical protein
MGDGSVETTNADVGVTADCWLLQEVNKNSRRKENIIFFNEGCLIQE